MINKEKTIKKKEVENKSKKIGKIASTITNMNLGEVRSPTNLFSSIKIHPNTGRDLLDLYDLLKDIGFVILRDKNKKIKGILRTDEGLDTRKDILEIKKQILELKGFMDKLKTILEFKK